MPSLKIPESQRGGLGRLLQAKPEWLDSLFDALRTVTPTLHSDELGDELVAKLAGDNMDAAAMRSIVRFLISAYYLRTDSGVTPERLAADMTVAAQESGDSRLKAPIEGWDKFRKRLSEILSLDETLGVSSKAVFVAYQTPRHLHGVRVLTDARPVFADDPSKPPAALVIVHTLHLNVREDGDDKEYYVSLDPSDLRSLRDAVERAFKKERSLKELLKKTGVTTLTWQEPTNADE